MENIESSLPDELSLVLAAQRGDRNAFGRLVERHERSVYLTVHRRLNNHAEAQEVCQEVFIKALEKLNQSLIDSDDDRFEVDMNNGALSIEIEDPPARFVVSPNAPVKQIWVSALTKSFKLDWDSEKQVFALPATGETLDALIARAINQQTG